MIWCYTWNTLKTPQKTQSHKHIKISSISTHQQWTVWERNQENNTIHNSIKYLEINLMKEVKDLYNENYKSLKKEINEDTRGRKDILCSWIDRINIMKMAIPPKAFYMFNAIPIKILMTFFRDIKISPKVHMETQQILNSQSNPQQKKQHGRYHKTWLQIILQGHSNKNSIVLAQDREEDQWNRTEAHEGTAVWFLTKEPKTCIGEKITSSTNGAEKTVYEPVEDWN
jgi:hypothetical protein